MKPLVKRFRLGGLSARVIEWALIIVVIDLACLTAWLCVSASVSTPPASATLTLSVETTGSVDTRARHHAPRAREAASFQQLPEYAP